MVALVFLLVGALQNVAVILLTAGIVALIELGNRVTIFSASMILLDAILGAFLLGSLTAGLVAGRWWGVITGLVMAVATILLSLGAIGEYTGFLPSSILLTGAVVGAVGGLLLYLALRFYNARIERSERE